MKENFSFHLEIKVLNSEGKTDAQRLLQVQCDVFSQMINWECVMASTVFYIVQSESGRLHSVCLFFFSFFQTTSCFLLLTSFMEMCISFSSRTWHRGSKLLVIDLLTIVLLRLIGSPPRLTGTFIENLSYCQDENETPDLTIQLSLKAVIKATRVSITPQQGHRLITSMSYYGIDVVIQC